jgi:hypothetical protein
LRVRQKIQEKKKKKKSTLPNWQIKMVLKTLIAVVNYWIPDFLSAPNFYFKAIPRSIKKGRLSIKKTYIFLQWNISKH